MQKITKRSGFEPTSLTRWKASNPGKTYLDLDPGERQDIRAACLAEQFYLCAYCCQPISEQNSMNEHVEARRIAPHRSLDFTNIVASCTTAKQCDDSHGSQPLPLTPFMVECETELEFKLSGRVEGHSARAQEAIRVLNLGDTETNNRALIERRKQFVHSILFSNGINPNDGLDDDELIGMVIEDISTPKTGKLEAYAPVAVNILNNWLR